MNTKHYLNSALQALISSTLILAVVMISYFFIEPQVGRAQDSSTFSITQTIIGETSFLVDATNVTMVGDLNGITGGTANGSTSVSVRTNSPGGYTMTIAFTDNAGTEAMRGETTGSGSIHDYKTATTSLPDYNHTASTSATFAYTVSAASTTDVAANFKNNGSVCGSGSHTTDKCWMEPTVAAFQVINRGSDAVSGATSTLHFRVVVPNNPTPGVVIDDYTATATLTVAPQ